MNIDCNSIPALCLNVLYPMHEGNMKYLNLLPCKLCPSDNYLMQNLNEQQQDQILCSWLLIQISKIIYIIQCVFLSLGKLCFLSLLDTFISAKYAVHSKSPKPSSWLVIALVCGFALVVFIVIISICWCTRNSEQPRFVCSL